MKKVDIEVMKLLKEIKDETVKTNINYEMNGKNVVTRDEVKSLLDGVNKIDNYIDVINDLKLSKRIEINREKKLILGMINILDSIEWLLDSKINLENEKLYKTVQTTKKVIRRELESMKIIQIPSVGDLYNENHHICVAYKKDKNLVNNEVVEVIKKGYIFNDMLIRQGEVIVINNDIEEEL